MGNLNSNSPLQGPLKHILCSFLVSILVNTLTWYERKQGVVMYKRSKYYTVIIVVFMIYEYKDLQQSEIEAVRKHYNPTNPVNLTETWMVIGELYGDLTYKCSIQEVAKVTII